MHEPFTISVRCFRSPVRITDSTDYAEWDDSGGGHYESHWGTTNTGGFWGDMGVKSSADATWDKTDMGWPIVPWGFRKMLLWIQARYRYAWKFFHGVARVTRISSG